MNKYEIMFILRPDLEEAVRNETVEALKAILTANDGSIDNVTEWGLRELAYEIKDLNKGYYLILDVTTSVDNINEFDRISKINNNVLRHLVIRKGE